VLKYLSVFISPEGKVSGPQSLVSTHVDLTEAETAPEVLGLKDDVA
jgi:hypothetical protein